MEWGWGALLVLGVAAYTYYDNTKREKAADRAVDAEIAEEKAFYDAQEEKLVGLVKLKCGYAIDPAKRSIDPSMSKDERDYQRETYLKFKRTALGQVGEITDQFYKSAALHHVIRLCVTAGDLEEAKSLYSMVDVDVIREAILKDHPSLADPVGTTA